MNLGLADKAAVVTGAASGIGRACVEALVAEGVLVAAVDRDAGGEEAACAAGAREFYRADVSVEAEIEAAVEAAAGSLGGIDLVVCSAGISGPVGTPAWEVGAADWDQVLAVNAKGPFLTVKHATPYLTARRQAAVVVVASDSSFVATPGMTPYCASKGAVLMLVRALAVDLEPRSVRVNCVCPSVVDTPMSRTDLGLPDGFAGTGMPIVAAEEVASHVVYLLSPAAGSINGTSLAVDVGTMARSSFPEEQFQALVDTGPTAFARWDTTNQGGDVEHRFRP